MRASKYIKITPDARKVNPKTKKNGGKTCFHALVPTVRAGPVFLLLDIRVSDISDISANLQPLPKKIASDVFFFRELYRIGLDFSVF